MRAYRLSTNLKLGLIAFAGLIAVASLWYTTRLVAQLKARETAEADTPARAATSRRVTGIGKDPEVTSCKSETPVARYWQADPDGCRSHQC